MARIRPVGLFQAASGFEIYNGVKQYTQSFATDGKTTMDIYKNSFFGDNGLTDQPRCGVLNDDGTWLGDPSGQFRHRFIVLGSKGDYIKLKILW